MSMRNISATGNSTSKMKTTSAEAAVADGIGNRSADANRRVAHHDVGELEHRLGNRFAPADNDLATLADHSQGDGKQDAKGDDLEHVAPRHRVEDRFGHDVEQHLVPRLRTRGDIGGARRREDDAVTGPGDVDGDEPDDQGDGGDNLEVDDRAQPHPADRLDVARARDARDQRRENQRGDDHLDHPQEQLAERPRIRRPLGIGVVDDRTNQDSEGEADEDLLGQADAGSRFGRCRRRHTQCNCSSMVYWNGLKRPFPRRVRMSRTGHYGLARRRRVVVKGIW
jgi:hypothetical protein